MIKDINLLKPDDGVDGAVSEFVENLAKADDHTGKLYPLGGYVWTVEVEYVFIPADVNQLVWYSPSKSCHNITVTFFTP